ncbi:cysteine dioxygenase [Actinomadura sp. DC4]|uniref:cysteine dioxygenase n=1 Tax=Actinomadura sp. DC4 TaxID=3055069 RepID=UPI0025B03E16|nr:cysteine dioxygenase [Actinomadura sp. DC4]MDN3357150.1 cysteine dioxygenase [Actinomadura sp. DC4]
MNFSVIPDITLQARPESGTVTIGRLAGVVREMAARPAYWWHLARFDGTPVPVADDLWLWGWPPGHRAVPAGPGVLTVLAGELSERTITDQGVAERTLRANRIRVYGADHPREVVNLGPGYALSLHATTA